VAGARTPNGLLVATFVSGLHAAVVIGGAAFLVGCGLTIATVGRGRQHLADQRQWRSLREQVDSRQVRC
jgi:hypothetical protein